MFFGYLNTSFSMSLEIIRKQRSYPSLCQQVIFQLVHRSITRKRVVIVPKQVQETVQRIKQDFQSYRSVAEPGLPTGDIKTDDNVALDVTF